MKKRLYPISILLSGMLCSVAVTACSDLLPINNDLPKSVEEGLPGIWHNTEISISQSEFMVKDDATGHSHTAIIPDTTFKLNKQSEYYCILKFTDYDVIPLSGGKAIDAELTKDYHYTISNDSVITTSLFHPRYSETRCYISNIKKGSFDFVIEEKGQPLFEENADSVCLSAKVAITFHRLR